MTNKPTLFGPTLPPPEGEREHRKADMWQALFIPYHDNLASPSLSKPIMKGQKPRRVKRRQGVFAHADAPLPGSVSHSRKTLYDYLRSHFLAKPVSIYTESGRIQGNVIDVTLDTVHLDTVDGVRAIDLHTIFSVAHKLPSP